jgi:hypothetical protein
MNKIVTINLTNNAPAAKKDNVPWYVRVECALKESVREVSITRATCNATRAALRDDLDAEYRAKAQAMMVKLMAKRGLDIKFD